MSWEGEQWRKEIRESVVNQVKNVLWGMVNTIEGERRAGSIPLQEATEEEIKG